MWLADTTFIIDLVNNDKEAVKKAREIDAKQSIVFISTITIQEYVRGVYYLFGANNEILNKKLLDAEGDLARFSWLDLNYNVAKVAAQIDANLSREGKLIGYADVLIAATAQFYNLSLLTRNKTHFERISNLEIDLY